MSRIASNITHLRKLSNLSQEKLAEALEITRSRLGSYEESRSEPPIELLIRISDFFKVSVDVLVRANLAKTSNPQELIQIGENRLLFPIQVDMENNNLTEVVSAKAKAGYLRGYSDPDFIEAFHQMKLPFLPTGKHRAFPIEGDSMPPLKTGSFVVGKYIENLSEIRNGSTYIILTQSEGITYKRVFVNAEKRLLVLHSDNIQYPHFEVKFEEVLEIWEYTCAIQTGPYEEDQLNYSSILAMLRNLQVEVQALRRSV
jgi:transcriptional regulator with XRE-family HTH domain